ncbi:hypothetical protein TruAng_007899 [Truncatella angustata]|nr:hypothetical protein TruAng_007899 [Truncatella angustata]
MPHTAPESCDDRGMDLQGSEDVSERQLVSNSAQVYMHREQSRGDNSEPSDLSASQLHDQAIIHFRDYERKHEVFYLDRSVEKLKRALDVANRNPKGSRPSQELIAINHDLIRMFANRYMHTRNEADLQAGISAGYNLVGILPVNDSTREQFLATVGYLHGLRYTRTGNKDDLDGAITGAQITLRDSPLDSLDHQDMRLNLAGWLLDRYHDTVSRNPDDLNGAIEGASLATRVLRHHDPSQQKRAVALLILASALYARFEGNEDAGAINKAIETLQEALLVIPGSHQLRPQKMMDLGTFRGHRFLCSGNIDDIQNVIHSIAEAQELIEPVGGDAFANTLDRLERWAMPRYVTTGMASTLDRFLLLTEEAARQYPNHPTVLYHLAKHLLLRSDRTDSKEDIDLAVETLKPLLTITNQSLYQLEKVLCTLTNALSRRFSYSQNLIDVDEAILLAMQALELPATSNTTRMSTKLVLCTSLISRFEATKDKKDLDEAVELVKALVESVPPNYLDRPTMLSVYGEVLVSRYETYRNPADIDLGISLQEEAVSLVSEDDIRRPKIASCLGVLLRRRFERSDNIEDLNLAIDMMAFAVNYGPPIMHYRSKMQINLGVFLNLRYFRVGALEDANRAIEITESILNKGELTDSSLARCLTHLASTYNNRFLRLKVKDDVDMAIGLMQRAVDETPDGCENYVRFSVSLGQLLIRRSLLETNNRQKDDIDEGIEHLARWLKVVPEDDPGLLQAKIDLGNSLRRRFHLAYNTSDIDDSIEILSDASTNLENDHTLRADMFLALGKSLESRQQHTKDATQQDRKEAVEAFSECFNSPKGLPRLRIAGADLAATILESWGRWEEALNFLKGALDLFVITSPRLLSRPDQQNQLKEFGGITSRATSVALNAGLPQYEALRLLEVGRGVMASLALERRVDVTMLDPGIASKFERARTKLETSQRLAHAVVDDDLACWVRQSRDRFDAEKDLQEIVTYIRSRPETKGFLDVPSLGDVTKVINDDTIVVLNESQSGCDAFLLDRIHGVRVVTLHKLIQPDVKYWVDKLRFERPRINPLVLEWLWTAVAEPVLEALGFKYQPLRTRLPRVWWIMVGMMSHLPIHAAGIHSNPTKTTLRCVVSAYAASLRAFVVSRTHSSQVDLRAQHKAVLVGMPTTPGYGSLPFATEEIRKLKDICPRLGLKPVELERPSKVDVMSHLADCSIFHFAGHGLSNPLDPSESGLMLEDGLLTVTDLQDKCYRNHGPFLGFLSACLTGANDMDALIDEGIHLISACQLAGFRHVIGTLWQVSDKTCVEVAERVYKAIAAADSNKDDAVCLGLHEAVVILRDSWAKQHFIQNEHADQVMDGQIVHTRDTKLKLKKSQPTSLIEANWIPYVCYSP